MAAVASSSDTVGMSPAMPDGAAVPMDQIAAAPYVPGVVPAPMATVPVQQPITTGQIMPGQEVPPQQPMTAGQVVLGQDVVLAQQPMTTGQVAPGQEEDKMPGDMQVASPGGNTAGSPVAPAEPGQEAFGLQLPVKQPLDLKHERLQGTILRYVVANGWGFVKSHMFEGELIFRTERIMPEFQGHPLHDGEAVEFDVQADDHGRPHATALKPVLGRRPYECLGQRHRGYVRRFAERWGFLNAAAFDGDLFVHRDNLLPVPEQSADGQPPLRAGQAVEFDVALDDRGRAVAKQITTRALLRPCDWIGNRLRGYIRSFQGAWGFINSDRFAGDLFVHRDSLLAQFQSAQLAIGTVVEFDVERDHHRKGAKNRLVARHVAVLTGEAVQQPTAAYQAVAAPQQTIPGMSALPMDPYGGFSPQGMPPGYGLNPQAASFAPSQSPPMYYQPQGTQPGGMHPDPQQMAAISYGAPAPQYPYPQPQYQMQHSLMPPQQPLPPQYAQQPYAPQAHYGQTPYSPQAQYPPGAQVPQMPQTTAGQLTAAGAPPHMAQPQAYLPPGVTAAGQSPEDAQRAAQQAQATAMLQQQQAQQQPTQMASPQANPMLQQQQQPTQMASPQAPNGVGAVGEPLKAETVPTAGVPPGAPGGMPAQGGAGGAVPVAADGQPQGLLHITMHDWEPDQPGQLYVTKGTLVNVSYRAAHGWVYAGTVQPGSESGEPASEGWIPQAVVKRVNLCRVFIDWPAEGSGTLGVSKGEIIAVSKEAERGWVYGERIGPRQQERPSDGWLPKKVLEYLQS